MSYPIDNFDDKKKTFCLDDTVYTPCATVHSVLLFRLSRYMDLINAINYIFALTTFLHDLSRLPQSSPDSCNC